MKSSFTINTDSRQAKLKDGTNANSALYKDSEIYEPPLITYYAKVVDNLFNRDITGYKNAMDNDFCWYYGSCNVRGGESQYIVVFDIWNNEPAFNHRFYDKTCKDAYNMKFNLKFNNKQLNDESYKMLLDNNVMQVKINNEYKSLDKSGVKITGNVSNKEGVLLGCGDHCILETKIVVPDNLNVAMDRYFFEVVLSYEYN